MGIRYVGESTAREIARHFGDIDAVAAASKEDLLAVQDVGEVIAQSVKDFFSDQRHIIEIQRLKAAGLQMSLEVKEAVEGSDALAGMTIVISGNFSISRDGMKSLIERHGGRSSGSVSGKTSFLLAGEKPGPEKVRTGGELGVRIVSEEEFFAMLPASAMPVEKPVEAADDELTLFG